METLQTQYSLAAENWRTIEGSLNARMTAMQKERDDLTKRETDARKRARDLGTKSRKLETDLETASEDVRSLTRDLDRQREEGQNLERRAEAAEKALEEERADHERQRRVWESTVEHRFDEERQNHHSRGIGLDDRRMLSPKTPFRRPTTIESLTPSTIQSRRNTPRLFSHDSSASLATDRGLSRRSSALPLSRTTSMTPDQNPSPVLSRPESHISLSQLNTNNIMNIPGAIPPTPSIQAGGRGILDSLSEAGADNNHNDDMAEDQRSSPHATVQDMLSASTMHTGPSVQLVERMSASIRRLESDKAAHKDEVSRLSAQRDAARNEVVLLMSENEKTKEAMREIQALKSDKKEIKGRYEACLEMLGEREEEVQELRADVVELKGMYKELAAQMGR